MKYTIFFSILCVYLISEMIQGETLLRYLLIWPITTSLVMGFAYLLNKPWLIMGKSASKDFHVVVAFINLPWLVITWMAFVVQVVMSREDRLNAIKDTTVSISKYPMDLDIALFDVIIDLTAEFPSISAGGNRVLRVPNLDGIQLANVGIPEGIKSKKILVHCAQGHGRSATYTSILLVKLGFAKNGEEALRMVLESRPLARVSKQQLNQIIGISEQ